MNLRMPQPGAPIAGPGGLITREWRDFLTRLLGTDVGVGLQEQIDEINRRLAEIGGDGAFLPSSTSVLGDGSIVIFGTLAGGVVTLTLAADAEDPGQSYYYGTNADGAKGWFPLELKSLRDVDAPEPNDGDALVWSEADQKWIAAPISVQFGNVLTDELGNTLTDQDGNPLTDGQMSVNWANIDNKPNTDGIPEGSTNLYFTNARAQSVADSRISAHVAAADPHPQYQLESGLGSAAFQSSSAFAPASLATYTVATLPSVIPAYRSIFVTDLTGTPGPCYSDGTNWRRYSDDSIAT